MSNPIPFRCYDFEKPNNWDNDEHACIVVRGVKFFIDKKWLEFTCSKRFYISPSGYMQFHDGPLTVMFHRFVKESPDGMIVNHENGVRSDNRSFNLSICTTNQNAAFRYSERGSGDRGVRKRKIKYEASILYNGKQRYLGRFLTQEEAARAYDEEAVKIYGRFATTNFPITGYKIPENPECESLEVKPFKRGPRKNQVNCQWHNCIKLINQTDEFCWRHKKATLGRADRKNNGEWLRVDHVSPSMHCLHKDHGSDIALSFSRSLCSYHYRKKREEEGYLKPKKTYSCCITGCDGVVIKVRERLCSFHYKEKYSLHKKLGRPKSDPVKCSVCGVIVNSRIKLCTVHYMEQYHEKNKSS